MLSVLMLVSTLATGLTAFGVQESYADDGDGAVPEIVYGSEAIKVAIKDGDHIYYGVVDENEPDDGLLYWRVLDKKTNTGSSDGIFLLSEYLWDKNDGYVIFDDDSNEWQGSKAQEWCSEFYDSYFGDKLGTMISGVAKSDNAVSFGNVQLGSSGLLAEKDKVFFLSGEELKHLIAINQYNESGNEALKAYQYGYEDEESSDANEPSDWWLRSPVIESGNGSEGTGGSGSDVSEKAQAVENLISALRKHIYDSEETNNGNTEEDMSYEHLIKTAMEDYPNGDDYLILQQIAPIIEAIEAYNDLTADEKSQITSNSLTKLTNAYSLISFDSYKSYLEAVAENSELYDDWEIPVLSGSGSGGDETVVTPEQVASDITGLENACGYSAEQLATAINNESAWWNSDEDEYEDYEISEGLANAIYKVCGVIDEYISLGDSQNLVSDDAKSTLMSYYNVLKDAMEDEDSYWFLYAELDEDGLPDSFLDDDGDLIIPNLDGSSGGSAAIPAEAKAGIISNDGIVTDDPVNTVDTDLMARPAFNLSINDTVLFASVEDKNAGKNKSSEDSVGTVVKVGSRSDNSVAWKLTLKDDSMSVVPETAYNDDTNITFSYKVDEAIENSFLSVVVMNGDNVKYYGKLASTSPSEDTDDEDDTDAADTTDVTKGVASISSSFVGEGDKVYVFQEKCDGYVIEEDEDDGYPDFDAVDWASDLKELNIESHTHNLVKHAAVAATCKAKGNVDYWVCEDNEETGDKGCGHIFKDAEGTQPATSEDVTTAIDPDKHAWNTENIIWNSSDYTSADATFTCTLCGTTKTVHDDVLDPVEGSSNKYLASVEFEGKTYTHEFTKSSGGGGGGGGGGGDTPATDAVQEVIDKINALPADPSVSDADAVKAANDAYNALTADQKKDERLTSEVLSKLNDAVDTVAAKTVESTIASLPEIITADNAKDVAAAKAAYDALTDAQKAKVNADSLSKLETAVKAARAYQTGEDGTALGKGASFEMAEAAILGMTSDADPAGSKLMPLKVKSVKQTKKSVKVQWSKPTGAVKYVLYGNKFGKNNKMKRLKTTTKANINFKKIAGKKVKKGTSYKFIVVALDKDNNIVSTSKVVHAVSKGTKKGNPTKLTVKTPKSLKKTLTAGKSFTIKSKVSKKKGTKVYLHVAKSYKGLRYESSNPAVAKVSKSGKVTAVSAGTAKIIVYAQNGVSKTVKVTVK